MDASTKVPIQGDSWSYYYYPLSEEQGEGICVVWFDLDIAALEQYEGYQSCVRVVLSMSPQLAQEVDFPSNRAMTAFQEVEASLLEELVAAEVDCRFTGSATSNGKREMVLQVEDLDAFSRVYAKWSKPTGWKIELIPDSGWDFYVWNILPQIAHWQQISDRQLIETLEEAGSDLSKEHELEFVFFGDPERLTEVASFLQEKGFEQATQEDEGRLDMVYRCVPEIDTIWRLSLTLLELAESAGIDYDGWEAAIVK